MTALTLAVDIGGTKLAVGVVDEHGRLLQRVAAPTLKTDDGEALFGHLTELISTFLPADDDAVARSAFAACGVGCGGPMSLGGETVSPLNIPAWRSFPLRQRLADYTGLATFVDNDAKALTLAEGWVGAATGVANFMGMVVSTGVGGGIVLDGRLLEGVTGNAGHIGHVIVSVPGRPLTNHVSGTLEGEASGTAIAAHTGHPAQEATTETVAETGRLVGQAAGSVANLLDIQLVAVAGSVALGFGEPFFTAAQTEMDRVCQLDYSRGAKIRPAGCGDEGPLIGAAAVALRGLGHQPGGIR